MLNTFENAERHHLRAQERQRHLQAMEMYSNGLTWEQSTLVSMVDELSGSPLETRRTFPRDMERTRPPRRQWHHLLTLLSIATALFVSGLAYRLGSDAGKRQSLGKATTTGTTKKNHTNDRRKALSSLILDLGITKRHILEDNATAPARALHWLVYNDSHSVELETIRTRFALASLYFSTQNASSGWGIDNHWLSSYPVCLWHGIECIDHHDTVELVKSVNLSTNNLIGTLPDELGLLGLDIQSIDLSNNLITGTIPKPFFRLQNLAEIYLGPNLISSTIPSSINQLKRATHLFINDCALTGTIPTEIGMLTNLRGLGIHNNFLTGSIPSTAGRLNNLVVLYLDNNTLNNTIPTTIGLLSNLTDLRLRRNMLSGMVPQAISNLHKARILYLDSNYLTGTLSGQALGSLRLLHELRLHENRLHGFIPSELFSLELVRVLYLDSNKFTGPIPDAIGSAYHLKSLYLFENNLTGAIPTTVGQLYQLEEFQIQNNKITGQIPRSLGDLSSLTQLRLHQNLMTGHVPLHVCVLMSYGLQELTADCGGESPKILCNCCTQCK